MAVPGQWVRVASTFGDCTLFDALAGRLGDSPATRSPTVYDNGHLEYSMPYVWNDDELGVGNAWGFGSGGTSQFGWNDVSLNRYWFFAGSLLFLYFWKSNVTTLVLTNARGKSSHFLLRHVNSVGHSVVLRLPSSGQIELSKVAGIIWIFSPGSRRNPCKCHTLGNGRLAPVDQRAIGTVTIPAG